MHCNAYERKAWSTMSERKLAFFVDDDQDFLEALQDILRHPRFEIQTYLADNGYKAIDEVIRRKPDVLFIDFNLPRANGGQILPVLRAIKSLRDVPVFFITGHSEDEILPFINHVKYQGLLKKSDTLISEVIERLDSIGAFEPPAPGADELPPSGKPA